MAAPLRQKARPDTRKVQVWIWYPGPGKRISVLVLKMRKDRGGYWQPVTGGVEKGERLPRAALREATEETQLAFKDKPRKLGEPFRFESRWGQLCEEQAFSLEAVSMDQVVLDPHEHVDYQWMSPSQAARILGFDSNRRILRELVRALKTERKSSWQRVPSNKAVSVSEKVSSRSSKRRKAK